MADALTISGVGPSLAPIRLQQPTLNHKPQPQAATDVGTAALKLIQSAVIADPAVGQNLDVLA